MSAPSLTDIYKPMIEADGERARRELSDLAAAEPQSLEIVNLLATAYLRCMDFAAAEAQLRAVLALNPADAVAQADLGLCLDALDRWPEALAAFRETAKTGSTDALIRQGLLAHRLQLRDEAASAYETVLIRGALDGVNQWPAMRGMMDLLRDQGRPLAADGYARELVQRFRRQSLMVSSGLLRRDQAAAFHEWYGLVDKARLARLLRKGLAEDPANGGRAPESFSLPEERAALAAFAQAQPPGVLYIVKPIRGSGGQGISVTADLATALDRTDVVVQRYIDRPYLVDGRKGHLRIYGLVTSADPVRAYVYSDGVVRFAPEPYDPRPERLGEVAMHVTNTALHKGHPSLVISDDAARDDVGSIWSVSALLRRMQADGLDAEAVFGRIADLVAWFLRLLQREGLFARQAARAPARSFAPKLFGLDVLVDADGMPWLIEVQAAPAATGAALVNRINGELYKTMFRMKVAPLVEDGMSAEAVAAILGHPGALAARELEIELANRGLFRPLDI